ncbi:hypothetical protein [Glycomyces tarimensis]
MITNATMRRVHARYLTALQAMPIPVNLPDRPEADRLTVLGADTIADREVRFGTVSSAPRLWIAFAEVEPPLLGFMTGLVAGEPDLWICEDAHRAWAFDPANARSLKLAGARVWLSCISECEG